MKLEDLYWVKLTKHDKPIVAHLSDGYIHYNTYQGIKSRSVNSAYRVGNKVITDDQLTTNKFEPEYTAPKVVHPDTGLDIEIGDVYTERGNPEVEVTVESISILEDSLVTVGLGVKGSSIDGVVKSYSLELFCQTYEPL